MFEASLGYLRAHLKREREEKEKKEKTVNWALQRVEEAKDLCGQ